MKITVDAQHLRAQLARCITDKSPGMPVLEHVLIRAGEAVDLLSTDTQMALTVLVEADTEQAGALCAHAGMLRAALNGLAGEVQLVHREADGLVVRAGRRRFRVPSLPSAEFPTPEDLAERPLEADPEGLREALQAVSYAASKDDVRYYLRGVYLGGGAVVATDGHRMAVYPVSTGLEDEDGIILPREAVAPVVQLLADGAKLSLLTRETRVVGLRAATPGTVLSVTLIDERYPDWRRVATPIEKAIWRAEIDPDETKAALARVMPFAEEKVRGGRSAHGLDVQREEGGLQLVPRTDPASHDFLACEVEGEPTPLCLEGRYLRDMLNAAGGQPVTWHGAAPDHVQAFTFDGRTDTHYIMPMRR